MRKIEGHAYAKINLTLDIEGTRDDGLHLIRSVMQEISLCDDLELKEYEGKSGRVRFFSNLKYLPGDDRNNAVKAAKRFFEAANINDTSLDINAFKRIPVAGGLGGSSTNAACVLKLLDRLHQNCVSQEKLFEIAASIGADVPFFLMGGCALAEDIGGKLTHINSIPSCTILVAKEGRGLSAGRIYKEFDESESRLQKTTDKMLEGLANADIDGACSAISNMLMTAASKDDETIEILCSLMKQNGAQAACMSGSGSSVYGIFKSKSAAENCKNIIEGLRPEASVFITEPISG